MPAAWFLAIAIAAPTGPVTLSGMEAPPYVLRYPERLSREARQVADAVPAIVDRLSRELGAPPPPRTTLYLVDADADPVSPASLLPDWAAGIALPGSDTVIIRVDRIGQYAQRQLLGVVAHETAHLMMFQAAGRGAELMPPWFREGVAGTLARDGEWMEFLYLWLSPVAASERPLAALDACFESNAGPQLRRAAYAGSFSFLRFVGRRHGSGLSRRVLEGLRDGLRFESAWTRGAGAPLALDERAWSSSMRGSRRWFAILTSSFALWFAITLLLLAAYRFKKARSRRLLEQWQEEDPFA